MYSCNTHTHMLVLAAMCSGDLHFLVHPLLLVVCVLCGQWPSAIGQHYSPESQSQGVRAHAQRPTANEQPSPAAASVTSAQSLPGVALFQIEGKVLMPKDPAVPANWQSYTRILANYGQHIGFLKYCMEAHCHGLLQHYQ